MRFGIALVPLVALSGCGGEAPARQERPPVAPESRRAPSAWEPLEPFGVLPRRRDPRTGIVFVRIPAGEFTMGGISPIDSPRHRVRISQPLWLGETEVTVGQWRTWVGRDGGAGEVPASEDERLPAGGVSWNDAQAFCATYGYVLPTEAQWEYACRAGVSESGPWESRATLLRQAWVYANAAGRAQPVGAREPNAFGLHDMLGNLWEWCADPYMPAYVVPDPSQPQVDPVGQPVTEHRVVRGGSWFSVPVPWPSDRQFGAPANGSHLFGFRVARSDED